MDNKNLEEIQDQIAICAKSEIKEKKIRSKSLKRHKCPKKKYKSNIKGEKHCPNSKLKKQIV